MFSPTRDFVSVARDIVNGAARLVPAGWQPGRSAPDREVPYFYPVGCSAAPVLALVPVEPGGALFVCWAGDGDQPPSDDIEAAAFCFAGWVSASKRSGHFSSELLVLTEATQLHEVRVVLADLVSTAERVGGSSRASGSGSPN